MKNFKKQISQIAELIENLRDDFEIAAEKEKKYIKQKINRLKEKIDNLTRLYTEFLLNN